MTKTKIDLLKIDMEAGKHWGQVIRDEELAKRHRAIRTKNRLKAQTAKKRQRSK